MTADLQASLDAQQKQIELLMKIVPKAKLAKYMPRESLGQTIRVSTYRASAEDEPRLVVGWSLIKDYVRVKKSGEIEEDQIVLLHLDGDFKQLEILKKKIGLLKDPDKVAANDKAIEELEDDMFIEIKLEDFSKDIEKVAVTVDMDKTVYARSGQPKEFFFELDGEEKSLLAPFVN